MLVNAPKLKTIALFVIGLSSSTYALASVYNPAFNGFYGGIMGGVTQTNAVISSSASSTFANYYDDANVMSSSQTHVNMYNHTGIAALTLGFGHFFGDSKYYWAAEIFGDWASRRNATLNNSAYHAEPSDDQDFSYLNTSTSVKILNAEYGADFRPGYQMDTNTLIYARFGVVFNRVINETTNDFIFTSTRQTPNVTFGTTLNQYHKQDTTTALRLGFGLERLVTNSLAVTADYIYTYYGRSRTAGVGNTLSGGEDIAIEPVTNVDGLTAQSSGRIGTQTAMLGLKYYFYPVG